MLGEYLCINETVISFHQIKNTLFHTTRHNTTRQLIGRNSPSTWRLAGFRMYGWESTYVTLKFGCFNANSSSLSLRRMSSSQLLQYTKLSSVVSMGLLSTSMMICDIFIRPDKSANWELTWSMGVMPVPPATSPIFFFMLGLYSNLGKGPLTSTMSPTLRSSKYLDTC